MQFQITCVCYFFLTQQTCKTQMALLSCSIIEGLVVLKLYKQVGEDSVAHGLLLTHRLREVMLVGLMASYIFKFSVV